IEEQQQGQHQGGEASYDIERGGQPVTGQYRQQHRGKERHGQQRGDGIGDHSRPPPKGSRAPISTVSNRSRIRNRNTPMTINATRMEKAMLISTTSGMPCAPAAARMMPFSIDRNPTTWLTALRLVTIISMPISTTDSASARSSRVTGSAWAVTGSITSTDSATSAMPTTMRRNAQGIRIALIPNAIAAVIYRCGASWMNACQATESARMPACSASTFKRAYSRS